VQSLGGEVAAERAPERAVLRRADAVAPAAALPGDQGHREQRERAVREGVGVVDQRCAGDGRVTDLDQCRPRRTTAVPNASPENGEEDNKGRAKCEDLH